MSSRNRLVQAVKKRRRPTEVDLMDAINNSARELVRELPKIPLKTEVSRIDYLASNALPDILATSALGTSGGPT